MMCNLRLLWRKNEGRGFVMLGIGSCEGGEEEAAAAAAAAEGQGKEKEYEN